MDNTDDRLEWLVLSNTGTLLASEKDGLFKWGKSKRAEHIQGKYKVIAVCYIIIIIIIKGSETDKTTIKLGDNQQGKNVVHRGPFV